MALVSNNLKVALAILAVFLFVFELVAIGVIGGGSLFKKKEEIIIGQTEFDGIVRTYEPFIAVGEMPDATLLNELRSMSVVKSVSEERGATYITLETREDVYPVATFLMSKNLTPVSIANIAPGGGAVVILENGEVINASFGSIRIRVETDKIVPPGAQVRVAARVGIAGKTIVGYDSAFIKSEERTVNMAGTVKQQVFKYVYLIPWNKRNTIDVDSLRNQTGGTVRYERRDTAFFKRELTQEEVMKARQLDYVVYIDKQSIVFSENFTDGERAVSDIGVDIDFKSSVLTLLVTDPVELDYNKSLTYVYFLTLESSNYTIPDALAQTSLESDTIIEQESVPLRVHGQFVGSVLFNVLDVALVRE
ncbi:MAG: hypothetical protein QXT45_05630 [Candidatus Bilamarchaeaceae archaeon]